MLQESHVTAEPSCRLTHTRCQCSVMLMTYCLLSLLATAFAVKPWQHQSWKSCVNFCKNIFSAKSSRKSPETSEISTNLQMIQPFISTVFCDHHKTFKTPAKSRSKFVCHFYTDILQRSQKQDRKTPQKAASPERASLVCQVAVKQARKHSSNPSKCIEWGPKNWTARRSRFWDRLQRIIKKRKKV